MGYRLGTLISYQIPIIVLTLNVVEIYESWSGETLPSCNPFTRISATNERTATVKKLDNDQTKMDNNTAL